MSIGLFLSKILSAREQLESDEHYGAFMSAIVPFNVFVIPFIPIGYLMNRSNKLQLLNKTLMLMQYLCLMTIFFIVFILVSIMLIPLAHIKSVIYKIRAISNLKDSNYQILIKEIISVLLFLFFGVFMLLLTLLADCYYFWINNFRTNLKKIVVENEQCKINLESFKRMINYCQVHRDKRMSALFSDKFIKNYREDIHFEKMAQLLIYG